MGDREVGGLEAEPKTVVLELLGPPRFRSGEVELPLAPRKPNQVVLLLAASAENACPSARLLDQIWDRDPDKPGMDSLKNAVYQVNRRCDEILGVRPIISRGGDGYALDLDAIEIDGSRFEAMVHEANRLDPEADAALQFRLASDALDLWRGDHPASGFQHLDTVETYARALEVHRLTARKSLFGAAMGLGRHDEVLAELTRTAVDHPFDESIQSSLMLALTRGGRQREAMEVYERLRRRLIDSAGIEPSPTVQHLQMQILTRHRDIVWRPPQPQADRQTASVRRESAATVPADLASLTRHHLAGRDGEMDLLMNDVGATATRLVVGPPGMGKSRLVAELAGRLTTLGKPVFYGRCRAERRAALEPIEQMIGATPTGRPAELQPEPQQGVRSLALTPDSDPVAELDRRIAAAVDALAERAGDDTVLIIEDAQWVDQATLDVVDRLEQQRGLPRLTVLLTCRPSALDDERGNEPLISWLDGRHWDRLDLGPLGEVAIGDLVSDALPERHLNRAAAVAKLVARSTGGVPLLVNEVLDSIEYESQKKRPFSLAHIEAVAPKTLTAAVHRRLLRLDDDAREVIKAAAVGGSRFELDVVARVVGRSQDETAGLLDVSVAESLITETRGVLGSYEFAHELLRNAVLAEVGVNHRARLHRRFADAVDVLRGPASDFDRAVHLLGALPLGEPGEVVEAALRAAGQAARRFDVDEAIGLLHRTLTAVRETSVSDASTSDLLTALAAVQSWGGEPAAAKVAVSEAVDVARRAEDPDRFASAVLSAGPNHRVVLSDDRLDLLVEARDRLSQREPSALSVSIEANLLGESLLPGRPVDLASAPAELLRLAREVGDPKALLDALFACHSAAKPQADAATRTRLSDQIVELSESAPDFPSQLCGGLGCRLYDLVAEGRLQAAARTADRLATLARDVSLPRYQWRAMVVQSALLRMSGRFDEADALSVEALTVGRSFDSGDAEVVFGMQLRETMRHTGTPAALVDPLRRVAALNQTPIVQLLLVDALLADDSQREAEVIWSELRDHVVQPPVQELWLPTVALAGELAANAFDDGDLAETVLDALTPFSGQWVPVGVPLASWGPVDVYLGVLAAHLGQGPGANRYFDRASDQSKRAGATTWSTWIEGVRPDTASDGNYRPFTDDK